MIYRLWAARTVHALRDTRGETGNRNDTMNTFSNYDNAATATRARLGVSRLTSVQAQTVRDAVARHAARQNNRPYVAPAPGAVLTAMREKRNELLRAIGWAYHDNIKPLFTSERGEVEIGAGGQAGVDYNAYAKSYGYAARWKNAGVRYEGGYIVLETARGKEAARIAFDFRAFARAIRGVSVAEMLAHTSDAAPGATLNSRTGILLPGDLYAIADPAQVGGYIRYALQPTTRRAGTGTHSVVRAGVTLRLPDYDTGRIAQYAANGKTPYYYEHGTDYAQCYAEQERKADLYRAGAERERIARLQGEQEKQNAKRFTRAAKLLARIGQTITATFADARASGQCDAGIKAWAANRGFDLSASVPLATLFADPDPRAVAVALHVAKTAIAQRHAGAQATA